MGVLKLSPHSLSYKKTVPGFNDENGDWVKGEERWIDDYCKCDVVPAGKANVIAFPDGSTHNYSYTVYNLPADCRDFKYGDKIRISIFGDNVEFTVLGFHRYQLQCKIWI